MVLIVVYISLSLSLSRSRHFTNELYILQTQMLNYCKLGSQIFHVWYRGIIALRLKICN